MIDPSIMQTVEVYDGIKKCSLCNGPILFKYAYIKGRVNNKFKLNCFKCGHEITIDPEVEYKNRNNNESNS